MPTYWYTLQADPPGTRYLVHAPSLPDALLALQARGVQYLDAGSEAPSAHTGERPVAEADLITLCRQLALVLRRDAPLPEGLRTIAGETPHRRLRGILRHLADATAQGLPLWEAMNDFPGVFRPEMVAVARAGEVAGELPEALDALAERSDTASTLVRRASLPLVYPLMVCVLAALVIIFVFTFIAPKWLDLFRELGLKEDSFPMPTLVMMWVARWFPTFAIVLFLIGLALIAIYLVYRRTASGRLDIDYWRMRVPLLGQIAYAAAAARLCATLAMLLKHRVPAPEALRVAGRASGSEALLAACRSAELVAEQGGTIAEGLKASEALPPPLLWRLAVAEKTGALPQTCEQIADFYVESAESLARRTIALAEPIVVIVLGLVLWSTVTGMFLPMVSIISGLSQ